MKRSENLKFPSFTCTWINVIGVIILLDTLSVSSFHAGNNRCRGQMKGIIFPDEISCNSYYRCDSSGFPTRIICPEGTLFDLSLYYCFAEKVVDCGSRHRPPPKIVIPPSSNSHHAVSEKYRKLSKNCCENEII